MGVPRKNLFTTALLLVLDLDLPLVPLESPYDFLKRKGDLNKSQYKNALLSLKRSRLLEIVVQNEKKFIKINQKGVLRVLLERAKISKHKKWDGKWRLILFDIPESFRIARNRFRKLLKQHGFTKLQASAFICPYELSSDAILYLKEAGLLDFIRILRIDRMDNDSDLKKKYKLN
jgi:CRISPR-associated endonuclease Cas2